MSDNKIIAVIGMCGSGKSEAVKFLVSKGFEKVYFGDVVIRELKANGLDINETNERMTRERLRKEYGMGVMALKSIDLIRDYYKKGNVVIESLYSWEEYKIIEKEFGDCFKLLTIFTTKELRYQRLQERKFRPLSSNEAISRDISEIENLDKGGPIAFTDYLLFNDSSMDELRNKLESLF